MDRQRIIEAIEVFKNESHIISTNPDNKELLKLTAAIYKLLDVISRELSK